MGETYTQDQKNFFLSILSNLAAGLTGKDIGAQLLKRISGFLKLFESQVGKWNVVWGPGVFQLVPGSYPDNVMYVAYCEDTSQYVVAIAGSNPNAVVMDWLIEDFIVVEMTPWPYGDPPPGTKIAAGTAIGLLVLETLKPVSGLPGAGQTLKQFLAGTLSGRTQPCELIVTGHSLGGALSSVTGLWLKDIQPSWDPGGKAAVSVWASAGPTAGNETFASYADTRLGGASKRIANALDVVPHAWNLASLKQLKSLYAPAIPENIAINLLVDFIRLRVRDSDYLHFQANAVPLPGQIDNAKINPNESALGNYLAQMLYQHVEAYFDLMGLPYPEKEGLRATTLRELSAAPPSHTPEELLAHAQRALRYQASQQGPLQRPAVSPTPEPIPEVVLPNGNVVRVSAGTDPRLLAGLLAAASGQLDALKDR